MGHPNTVNCKRCGRRFEEPGSLSWTRHCAECSEFLLVENVYGLATMSNPKVTGRWRRGMILSAGGLLPEQLQPRS
jgi:hypothetical protein